MRKDRTDGELIPRQIYPEDILKKQRIRYQNSGGGGGGGGGGGEEVEEEKFENFYQ